MTKALSYLRTSGWGERRAATCVVTGVDGGASWGRGLPASAPLESLTTSGQGVGN
jgi:hypothetical protein